MSLISHVDTFNYQRNGVSGEGFYALDFLTTKDGGDGVTRKLKAIVFSEPGYCAVLTPEDPTDCWRGDVFEPELRERIRAHETAKWGSSDFNRNRGQA